MNEKQRTPRHGWAQTAAVVASVLAVSGAAVLVGFATGVSPDDPHAAACITGKNLEGSSNHGDH